MFISRDGLAEVKYGKDHKQLTDGNIPVYGSVVPSTTTEILNGMEVFIPSDSDLEQF
jgi:hypothetical protein